MSQGRAAPPLVDLAVEVTLSPPKVLGEGFRRYERYEVTVKTEDGIRTETRDLLRVGGVAAVLPVDPARGTVVVMHQFRLAAHLTLGKGLLIETVAGHVEPNETAIAAARRECLEEIGVVPSVLVELFSYLPTPGLSDEQITLFVGVVDSSAVPERSGAAAENEVTRPYVVPIDDALDALARRTIHNGPLIQALHWLAFNRNRLDEIIRTGRA